MSFNVGDRVRINGDLMGLYPRSTKKFWDGKEATVIAGKESYGWTPVKFEGYGPSIDSVSSFFTVALELINIKVEPEDWS